MNASDSKRRKQRPGTANKGQQYEILLPALLSLKLFQDDSVTDFILETNIKNFGCFDDLIVKLVLSDGTTENYALQLKHKEKQNLQLKAEALEGGKNDFNIMKYCESFSKIRDIQNFRFIIYTNAYFTFEELDEFVVKEDGDCSGKKFFFLPSDDNEDKANIYTFSSKRHDNNFFKKFSFYTAQKDWREVEDLIVQTFEKIFHIRDPSIAMGYINIFKLWNLWQFSNMELSKENLKIKIFDLILSPYIVAPSERNSNGILEPEFSKFDVVIIKNLEDTLISKLTSEEHEKNDDILRLGKHMKFLTKDAKDFSIEVRRKTGYYRNKKPILLKINNTNQEIIIAVISKLKQSQDKLHFVLVGEDISKDYFPNFTVFETLQDLIDNDRDKYHELINKMKIFIRCDEYSFSNLFGQNISWAQHVKIEDIAKMILGDLHVNTNEEILAQPYISRHLTSSFIKIDSISEIDDDLIVVSYKENERVPHYLGNTTQRKIISVEEYLKKEVNDNESLICQENITKEELDLIIKKSSTNVHNLAIHDNDYFEWISTKGSIRNLKNVVIRKISTHESEIFEKYQNQINVVASAPGRGKSELLKKLKNICPSKFFPVHVNVKEHESFFKNDNDNETILNYFLNYDNGSYIFAATIKSLANKQKIYFFFDGIDELRSENIKVALQNIKILVDMGFKVWMSCRKHLQKEIENCFNIFAVDISNFSDDDQILYIKERLHDRNDVDRVVEIIFKNFSTILKNRNVLDVPLQLFMISEIFISRDEITTSEFVLTKMFHYFYVGKYRHFFNKNKCFHWDALESIINDSIIYRKLQYQIAALKSCLNNDEFMSLKLEQDENFLRQVTLEGDFLGIISKIIHKIAIFNHNTTSTYFAALWFADNYKKIDKSILKLILFKKEYHTIRLMFDMILAEDFSAHVAVLYRNIEDLKVYKNCIGEIDSGGRSVLHLTCFHNDVCPTEVLNHDKINSIRKGNEKFRKILNFLLDENQDLLKTESVFQLNCLEIANETMSLLPLDVILENNPKFSETIKHLNNVIHHNHTVLFYCTIFGYSFLFQSVYQDSSKMEEFLHLAAMWNSWQILSIILEKGVDVDLLTSSKRTPLHLASSLGHLQTVVLLLFKNANVNAIDKYGRTPLHFAADNGHLLIVKKLLDFDANIDQFDQHGRTPLHLAVEKGHENVTEYLLDDRKANINQVAHNGWGPLHLAVVENRSKVVKMSLDRHVDFNKMDEYGTKPIHLAARSSSVEILEMLLQKCENIDDLTNDRKTSLHIAAEHGNLENFKFLVENGANINACDDKGRSVIHWAVIGKQPKILDVLLRDNRIKINVFDKNKRSVLSWACILGDLSSVELLLPRMSTLINFQDMNGATPLHWAAYGGHSKIVELLLSNGAHIDVKDSEGKTPLQWALPQHHQATIDLLQHIGTRKSFLYSQSNNRWSS